MLIKKGMKVRVISGAHKGSEGKVLFTSPKKQRIIRSLFLMMKMSCASESLITALKF